MKEAKTMALRTEKLELAYHFVVSEYEDELIDSDILDSHVPDEEPSGSLAGDYMTFSEAERLGEYNVKATDEDATRRVVTKIVMKIVEETTEETVLEALMRGRKESRDRS